MLLITIILSIKVLLYAQNSNPKDIDSSINLPKGTYLKDGNLYVKNGYKIVQSPDKKTITIVQENAKGRDSSPESTPTIKCKCNDDTNCGVLFSSNKIECFGPGCCYLYFSKSTKNLQNTSSDSIDNSIKWERIITKPNHAAADSVTKIDITEIIKNKKVRNGTVLVYENDNNYKIYTTYKNGRLTEWYAIGEDGRKIKSSSLGITPINCEDCIVLPNGTMVCKKCTNSPGITLPAKSVN